MEILFVAYAINSIVSACHAVSGLFDGFRMTQGWGSVGSIIVGISAIVAASVWNKLTLDRAAERYESDRRDAQEDKVRAAVVELSGATTEWSRNNAFQVAALKAMATAKEEGEDEHFALFRHKIAVHHTDEARPALNAVVKHVRSALLLTSEQTLQVPIARIGQALMVVNSTSNEVSSESSPEELRDISARLQRVQDQVERAESNLLNAAGDLLSSSHTVYLPPEPADTQTAAEGADPASAKGI